VDKKLTELARRMEEHELAVWATCVDAVSALPDNPLGAVVDRSGPLPLVALCAADRRDINRVVALGVRHPARTADLDAIRSFYEAHDQRNFRIEVAPIASPTELSGWITARGLASEGLGTFKMWRRTERPPPIAEGIDVRRLGPADIDALTAINIAAWGAWNLPVSIDTWFGATVGYDGVRHYGIFDADRLVSTGALFFGEGIGWLGFDATHPRYQGRRFRQAISSVRMIDAAAEGCSIVHAESAIPPSERALRDRWQLLYERQNYSSAHVTEGVSASASHGRSRRQVRPAPSDHG
jgi:hypothetical protein